MFTYHTHSLHTQYNVYYTVHSTLLHTSVYIYASPSCYCCGSLNAASSSADHSGLTAIPPVQDWLDRGSTVICNPNFHTTNTTFNNIFPLLAQLRAYIVLLRIIRLSISGFVVFPWKTARPDIATLYLDSYLHYVRVYMLLTTSFNFAKITVLNTT